MINVVLVEPEIPQNTGNIARTCAATGARLHLIEPLGFKIGQKEIKRAGLDYWHLVDITTYKNYDEFLSKNHGQMFYCSTKARNVYSDIKLEDDVYFIFGKETKGLDENLLKAHPDECIRIPMISEARSLNLSNSVAIIVYDALRQKNFEGLLTKGELHNLKW